ncbi:phosphoribosylformylglycinamidine synthase subunit PurQ [Thermovibrio ammonificans]|jgi:phosphoribosylformylglycinamidine synthase|uniref:Phosphoribosylformylglycinamidine synthase subunit PurQ n=1 Tax=Thermovibrio ammonificans (strain DSM 15698 / JCM 12110 / HB-1) TaxID=648996 RepID=E8T6A3_THEA1|nr:phosphoribosylformylglycinamidine synthase subunit PurQ [Thermovibrio ammonificans]ADU96687.1 phosphoribosylformylglycinamidine synthase I [Thermovibrio ammonificans HB-1]
MKFGIPVYPGSNCDRDVGWVIEKVLGHEVKYLWHKERDVKGVDCVIVPGGFSYGDYLRAGAMAKLSPVTEAIYEFAQKGGLVMGICNGFQILLEAGLLPGAMLPNKGLTFVCKFVHLKVENNQTPFTRLYEKGEVVRIPIAHAEGNYTCPPETLKEIEENGQVVVRYCSPEGEVSEEYNPNGSLNNIAGICNKRGNVFGLMPHPERASEAILGSTDGLRMFKSIVEGVLTA